MKKTNVVLELGMPLLGCAAFVLLISFLWDMRSDNQQALAAEKAGPIKIQFNDLLMRNDLDLKRVEITGATIGPKYSITKLEHGTSGAFLLFPDQKFNLAPDQRPVIVQDSSIETKADAEKYLKKKKLTGTVTDEWSLNFAHQKMLEKCYPGLDLDRCTIISSPSHSYSKHTEYVVYGGMLFFGAFLLSFLTWLYRSIKNAFANGIAFSPESEVPDVPAASTVQLKTHLETQLGANAIESKPEKTIEYVSSWYSFSSVAKTIGIVVFTPTLLMAFVGKAKLLPDNFMWVFYTLFALSLCCLVVYVLALTYQLKSGGKNVRWPLSTGVNLPRRFRRAFQRCENKLLPLGFHPVGDFQMKEHNKELAREFLSEDGRILFRYVMTDDIKIMTIYSLMASGQLILTTDLPLGELNHYLVNLLAGVKGKFEETISIHRQAVDGFDDVIIRIQPDELHAFWRYEETIEEQMTGKIPYSDVPLPMFRDLANLIQNNDANENSLAFSAEVQ